MDDPFAKIADQELAKQILADTKKPIVVILEVPHTSFPSGCNDLHWGGDTSTLDELVALVEKVSGKTAMSRLVIAGAIVAELMPSEILSIATSPHCGQIRGNTRTREVPTPD